MPDANDKMIPVKVRVKPSDASAQPRVANSTTVSVAQGIAYLDFGFLEPVVLAAIAKTAKDGQLAPKGVDGMLVTRVAMPLESLARLQQQLRQVVVGLREARRQDPKAES